MAPLETGGSNAPFVIGAMEESKCGVFATQAARLHKKSKGPFNLKYTKGVH